MSSDLHIVCLLYNKPTLPDWMGKIRGNPALVLVIH